MTETMLQKAAAAIHEELRDPGEEFFVSLTAAEQDDWCHIARAALLAIREPSEAFVEQAMGYRNATPVTKAVSGRFTAMIDAILSEEA